MTFAAKSAVAASLLLGSAVHAADLELTIHQVNEQGVGESIGTITFRDTSDLGLVVIPSLKGLPPGAHGFHIHENPDCSAQTIDGKPTAAGAAGDHYDPQDTGRHAGPVGNGHLGDMPELLVDPEGNARMAVVAPRLEVPDIVGRSVMIHEGEDNYSDQPKPFGGSGARLACGIANVDKL